MTRSELVRLIGLTAQVILLHFGMEPLLQQIQSSELFRQTWHQEDRCEKLSDEALPKLGKKASKLIPSMERVLSYLDAISSCAFGCEQGDHALERLLFRCCNRARAAVRLSRLGYYDESLMITRALGEAANLMLLFTIDASVVDAWRRQEKWARSAVEIRKALEVANHIAAVDQSRYSILSGLAAHADPNYAPSAFNVLAQPVSPGSFSEEGLLVTFNEISFPLGLLVFPATSLFTIPQTARVATLKAGAELIRNVGGFMIDKQTEYWDRKRSDLIAAIESEGKTSIS